MTRKKGTLRVSGKYYMGIDQGTTGTTVLLLDGDWNLAAQAHKEHKQYYPRPGWVEHDPEEILRQIMEAACEVLQDANVLSEEVRCIGIDNQGETVVVWDKETGKPVYPAIVWQDRRTAAWLETLHEKSREMIRNKTGLQAVAYFGATKIKWILDTVEGAREKAEAGKLLAGPLDAWILWNLTGRQVFATDYSTASRTMLFNIHKQRWDEELLKLFDIPGTILPKIRCTAELYGYASLAGADGREGSIPVSGNIVDQQAALFGQACLEEGMAKTTYGTGCFMLMNTGERPVYTDSGLLTSVAWKLKGQNIKFELDGGIYVAGSVITWMKNKMNLIASAEETNELAASVPDTAGVYFVPAMTGLAAPYWDPYARGMLIGITPGTEKAHIVRAALESIAYQVKDILDLMEKDSGIEIRAMRADGGITSNEFLMQFQADILGIPIDVPVIAETTALGAAYIAAYGIGEFKRLSEIEENWKLKKRYFPRIGEAERNKLMSKWHRAVERARGWIEEE